MRCKDISPLYWNQQCPAQSSLWPLFTETTGTTGQPHFLVPGGLSPGEGRDQAVAGVRKRSCWQAPASTGHSPWPKLEEHQVIYQLRLSTISELLSAASLYMHQPHLRMATEILI